MKNNKGITLVEIIISVSLISIVLVFLFNMLIQVNNENSDNEIKSSYLVNQSTFIKQIEEDFLDYKLQTDDTIVGGSACTVKSQYYGDDPSDDETNENQLHLSRLNGNIKCIKFNFNDIDYKYAYLFLYERDDGKTILSYYRGDFKQSVELEDFDWLDNDDNTYIKNVKTSDRYQMYSLPIIGPDGNDYSINLSYIG